MWWCHDLLLLFMFPSQADYEMLQVILSHLKEASPTVYAEEVIGVSPGKCVGIMGELLFFVSEVHPNILTICSGKV